MSEGELILAAGGLLAAGLLASLIAGRVRVPGLVLFLAIGMIAGSDISGLISFENYQLTQNIGIVALALILFEGGLTAGLPALRPVLGPAISLATLGTLLTALVTGVAAYLLFDVTLLQGLLLGAVVCATDGAAIFAVLRGSSLKRRLARTLEGEAGVNDPVAILLVLGFVEWIQTPDYGIADMALLFVQQLGIGLAVGAVVGWLAIQAFWNARLTTSGLYPVASLAAVALSFGGADVLHGSGFLATYIAGVSLGSVPIPAKPTIVAFHVGLAWVAQITMFFTLGLLVFPSELKDVAVEGTVLALVLAFVARPAATFIATLPWRFSTADRVILGWAGLRGAVPVVLATFPVIAHVSGADNLFNIVFFAVVLSTLVQGVTFEPLAERLGVTSNEPALPRPIVEIGTIRRLGADVIEHEVEDGDAAVGARVRELGLPRDAIVSLLVRNEQALLPRGSTRIEAGDRLHVLVRREVSDELPDLLDRWRDGPVGSPARPPRRFAGTVPVYTVRPWDDDADGDPSHPTEILGRQVVEHLRTRRDVPGAMVVLEDGRYAVTGPLLMVGPPTQLQFQARRRFQLTDDDAARAWWQEVIGACAL
jgi:cell volume regulation protein A